MLSFGLVAINPAIFHVFLNFFYMTFSQSIFLRITKIIEPNFLCVLFVKIVYGRIVIIIEFVLF